MIKSRFVTAFIVVAASFVAASGQILADDHQHHPPHNMVVFGVDEVFASHIVYKTPHNYQVEMAVTFPTEVQAAYRAARSAHPNDTFIFLLDSMNIAEIARQERLTGALFRLDADDQRFDIAPAVALERNAFRIVFFQELPLSLSRP